MKGAWGIIGTGAAGGGMYGDGSRGLPRMTGAVLAASELANSRICPGGSVRGLAATFPIFLQIFSHKSTAWDTTKYHQFLALHESVIDSSVVKYLNTKVFK